MSVRDVLGPHTYLSSPVFLAGNDSRMMKVSDVAHCRRIDFAFSGQSLVVEKLIVECLVFTRQPEGIRRLLFD